MINYEIFDKSLNKAIDKYMPSLKEKNDEYVLSVINDIILSKEKYHFDRFDEYFIYDFINADEYKRKTFFGEKDYNICVKNSFDGEYDDCPIFKNKVDTYNLYKKYYKRDVISIDDFNDFPKFIEFVNNNKVFIVKEKQGSLGINISKFNITDASQIKSSFFKLLQYNGCICEGWIKQCEAFAQFCNTCVNTIRIVTIYDDRGLTKLFGMFRTGRDGSVVDNISIGGIAAAIDLDTGIVVSDGYTKTSLEHFSFHPNSHIKFKDFQIPRWDEVIFMVEEMHKLHKESKIVGWDLTLTDEGWVLVEGNGKPNINACQIISNSTNGCGLYDVINNALGRYRIK